MFTPYVPATIVRLQQAKQIINHDVVVKEINRIKEGWFNWVFWMATG
jgi:hypothetical protein